MFTQQIYRYRNEEKTMKQWADKHGITLNALRYRWNKGWRGDKLFAPIPDQCDVISYNHYVTYDTGNGEETKTIKEWAEEIGMPAQTLALRYYQGDRGNVLFRRKYHHAKHLKTPHEKKSYTIDD